MDEEEIKKTFAKNLIYLRKSKELTQLQFANEICYSDKSISKWETGEATPDIFVFKKIADYFSVTIDELLTKDLSKSVVVNWKKHLIINLLSIALVWLIATIVFFIFKIFVVEFTLAWLSFIYAIPLSAMISVVLSLLWFPKWMQISTASILVWSLALTVFLTFKATSIWLIFVIASVLQFMVLLWFLLLSEIRKHQNIDKEVEKIK